MAGNKDGKDLEFPHEDSQLQDSQSNPPFEESQQLQDSQQDVSSPDSEGTPRLSPNCVPKPLSPSPSPLPEGEESSAPLPGSPFTLQEESEESSGEPSGDLTPPIGFTLASDGSLHGDMNMMNSMMADPATLMILNVLSGVIGKKLAERVNTGSDGEGSDGKGSGGKGSDGKGSCAKGDGQGYGASSSALPPAPSSAFPPLPGAQCVPSAKSKAKASSKRGKKKFSKHN